MPFCLDFEPYVLENQVSAQDAMMILLSRLRQRKPHLKPHLVVDSAFGSFKKLKEITNVGGSATMSMAATVKPWLWELLDFKCGINEGRLAFLPDDNIVVSSFKVLTEAGKEHQIKTISSGCRLADACDAEEIVQKIVGRTTKENTTLYETQFMDGRTRFLTAQQFIDEDGTINLSWLSFVNDSEIENALEYFTLDELKVSTHLGSILVQCSPRYRLCVLHKAGNRPVQSLELSSAW